MSDEILIDHAEARDLATRACLAAGANQSSAYSLVDATLSAALYGPAALGFPHLVDYLNSFREGRINCAPKPTLQHPFPAFLVSDAHGGIAQLGFDLAFMDLINTVRNFGVAIFTQTNSYTTGELGYYVRRLAEEGIIGLAATNANAVMVARAGGPAVYSTNPMAFGFPLGDNSLPLIIDQASSATDYVNIVAAAEAGRPIPVGWAVDVDGNDTQDPQRALEGALLPFGGRKSANVALFVEMLSAGLSGGPWSLDAPDFKSGNASPTVGLTVVAIMPGLASDDRAGRAQAQAVRLQRFGVFIPGVSDTQSPRPPVEKVRLPRSVFDAICGFASN